MEDIYLKIYKGYIIVSSPSSIRKDDEEWVAQLDLKRESKGWKANATYNKYDSDPIGFETITNHNQLYNNREEAIEPGIELASRKIDELNGE